MCTDDRKINENKLSLTHGIITEQSLQARVLLLEDYLLDADLIQIQLRRIRPEWNVHHVTNKTDFKRELLSWHPDIVVSDYALHSFTGIDALNLTREMGLDIPFILVTGELTEEQIIELSSNGIDDYILKSSLLRLESAIVNAIQRRKAENERSLALERLNDASKRFKAIFERAAIALIEFQIVLDYELREDQYANYMQESGFIYHLIEKTKIAALNDEAYKLFGTKNKDELEAHFVQVFKTYGHQVIKSIVTAFLRGELMTEVELSLQNLRGDELYLKIRTTINKGRIPSFTASFIDLTAIKRSEEEVSKVLERLETTVEDRTAELSAVNRLLKDEAEARDRINGALRENYIQMTESIIAAKRIQQLLLPSTSNILRSFSDAFIYMRPKDIVSGDFYWFHRDEQHCWIACVDCTGHGVPGAFMSMIGAKLLSQTIIENRVHDPGIVLQAIDYYVVSELKQHDVNTQVSTGMDISLCHFDFENHKVSFAGAFHQLYHVHEAQLEIHKGNRYSLGGTFIMENKEFTTRELDFSPGDTFYLCTDGFVDQFGGNNVKKFTKRRLQELILNMQGQSMYDQELRLKSEFQDWKGANPQIDDILVIGLKV